MLGTKHFSMETSAFMLVVSCLQYKIGNNKY